MLELMKQAIANRVRDLPRKTQQQIIAADIAVNHAAGYMLVTAHVRSEKELRNAWEKTRDAAKRDVRMQLGISWFAWMLASFVLRKIVEAVFDAAWERRHEVAAEYAISVARMNTEQDYPPILDASVSGWRGDDLYMDGLPVGGVRHDSGNWFAWSITYSGGVFKSWRFTREDAMQTAIDLAGFWKDVTPEQRAEAPAWKVRDED